MNTKVLDKVESSYLKADLPEVNVGDTVEVDTLIRDGDKTRIQKFAGIIIAKKGRGLSSSITVRKISNGVGVEKILPVHSPNIGKITVQKRGNVRSSKLYYMRGRKGRSAMRVKQA